uniref:Uncharacterized protein n=1 Tax=Lepeophtheirus salmonis TaxID=72036 RepID=A0A0K2TXV2_LEPSM
MNQVFKRSRFRLNRFMIYVKSSFPTPDLSFYYITEYVILSFLIMTIFICFVEFTL